MRFCGIQKLTLLDYPGKTAATVFTGGCNLRCPFCHNAELVLSPREILDEEEIFSFLRKRRGLLDGVAVTGGEPLLQSGLPAFLARCKDLGFSTKLDTNGCFPERLRQIVEQGLADYVAMDIKNAPERYAETVGCPAFDLAPVQDSAAFLMEGRVPWEFRTTVVKEFHTRENFVQIAQWLKGAPLYILQNFLDSGKLMQENLHAMAADEMHACADLIRPAFGTVEVRGLD